MVDIADLIRAERLALVDLLETLTPGEWATPSLCDGWSVRDVATHLAWTPAQGPMETIVGLLKGGLRINRINLHNVTRWSRRGTEEILDQLRANAPNGAKPLGMPVEAVLTGAVVHALDIRRPLGRPGPIARDAFVTAADILLAMRWPLTTLIGGSARQRVRGVRLAAADLDWSHGEGPDVHGSAESILLLLSGRPLDPMELTGAGAGAIYDRL